MNKDIKSLLTKNTELRKEIEKYKEKIKNLEKNVYENEFNFDDMEVFDEKIKKYNDNIAKCYTTIVSNESSISSKRTQ